MHAFIDLNAREKHSFTKNNNTTTKTKFKKFKKHYDGNLTFLQPNQTAIRNFFICVFRFKEINVTLLQSFENQFTCIIRFLGRW